MKKKTFRQLEFLLHIITAAILLIKACDEIARGLYFPGCILAGLGCTVLTISLFWKKLKLRPKHARAISYYIEAPALLITAYILYLEKKESLLYIFLLAGMLYPMLGFVSSKTFKKINRSANNAR